MKTPILVAFSFFLAIYSASAALLKKAEITAVINEVRLLEANATERGANVKDVVQGQTAVRTGLQSRSELLFQDKTLTRLGANTFFSFTEGTRDLELEHGTMLLQCPKGVGGAKIRTAAVTAAITGTTILLEYSPAPGPKRAPGYVPTIAKMTTDEASAELRHPRRTYTKAERSTLEAKAKQRQKGGSGGYVKVLVLEGTLRLYLNTRVGESVLITAGHMTILDPHAITIPPAVEFDISQLASTSLLVNNKFWGGEATEVNMALVAREVTVQDKLKSHGELLATNLVIPGGGTEVFTLAQLNQSIEAQDIILQTQQNGTAGASGGGGGTGGGTGSTPAGGAGPTGSGSPPSSSSNSPLVTITTPDPYVVGTNTIFSTDPVVMTNTVPTVTTNGVAQMGATYRSSTLDGPSTVFEFGSTSAFDLQLDFGFGNYFKNPLLGDATFKFADLVIAGPPTINTSMGSTNMSLISVGTITTAAPGGTINLDASPLIGLFLGTVNGSITLGPELSFASTATYASTGTPMPVDSNLPLDIGLYLEAYARGASSDVVLNSSVNFVDRDLRLEAEHDVEINSAVFTAPTFTRNFPYSDVSIVAGNDFILGPNGHINVGSNGVFEVDATDVIGMAGPGSLFASQMGFTLRNPVSLSGSGSDFLLNTLYISFLNLQSLYIFSNQGITIPSFFQPPAASISLNLQVNSDPVTGALVTINDSVGPLNLLFIGARDLSVGPSGVVTNVANFQIELTETASPAALSQVGSQIIFRSLPIDTTNLFTVGLQAPSIQISTDLNLPSTDVQLFGNVSASGNMTAQSIDFDIFRGTPSPVTDTVSGNINVPSGLSIPSGSLTVGGTVTADVISFAPFSVPAGNTAALTASSVSAPGGLNFPGFPGFLSGGISSAPTDGVNFTLTANSASFGTASFDGGPAAPGSGLPGANGGSLTVISQSDLNISSSITASTGANDTGVTSGGIGGGVNLNATNGAVTVSSTIQVSSNDVPNRRVSNQGGNITLQTGKISGTGIQVTNTGQLLSLLNATAPGPGGTVQLISAGADISVDGTVQADRGTIDIHNNGAAGNVAITSNAQLSADVIKAGALGPNGQLTISAGSQINANTLLKLYGGTGASGLVLFTGAGNVNISGSQIHIAATTVQVGASTHVNNSGSTFVHATNHNYGIGAGGGNFQNPVTAGSLTGAPPY